MRSVNNSVETINAAATAIVSAESRVQQTTVQVYSLIERFWLILLFAALDSRESRGEEIMEKEYYKSVEAA